MELTKKCTKKNVYQEPLKAPFDYTDLNKSKSFLTDRENVPSFFDNTEQGKTSILSYNKINIPQEGSVCT